MHIKSTLNELWDRSEYPDTPLEYFVAFLRLWFVVLCLSIIAITIAGTAALATILFIYAFTQPTTITLRAVSFLAATALLTVTIILVFKTFEQ